MLNQYHITVNSFNEKKLKKDGRTRDNYKKFLDSFLTNRNHQRFNPYSMFDCVLKALATAYKANWIATLNGDRRQRWRDQRKGIFKYKKYELKTHSFGTTLKVKNPNNTSYYKQAWFVGNRMDLKEDVKNARIHGAELYYADKNIAPTVLKITYRTCQLLDRYYRNQISYSQMMGDLRKSVYAITKGIFDHNKIAVILEELKKFCSIGRADYVRGGKFGRLSGRRSGKITLKELRPYNFSQSLNSKEGRNVVHMFALDVCKELKVKLTNHFKQRLHIAIRQFYWSDKYIDAAKEGTCKDIMDIIRLCLDKALLDVIHNNVHNYVHNYVYKPASNSNKSGHYSSPYKRKIKSRINSNGVCKNMSKKLQPPLIFSNELPCGAPPNHLDSTLNTENTAIHDRLHPLEAKVGTIGPIKTLESTLASKLEEINSLRKEFARLNGGGGDGAIPIEEKIKFIKEERYERKKRLTTSEKIRLMFGEEWEV